MILIQIIMAIKSYDMKLYKILVLYIPVCMLLLHEDSIYGMYHKTFWHDGVKSPGVVKVLQYFSYINELSIMKQYYPIMSQIFSKH